MRSIKVAEVCRPGLGRGTLRLVMAPVCQRTAMRLKPGWLKLSRLMSRIRQRSRRLRSWGVVVGACHRAGTSWASWRSCCRSVSLKGARVWL
jgi:hypothetical protein